MPPGNIQCWRRFCLITRIRETLARLLASNPQNYKPLTITFFSTGLSAMISGAHNDSTFIVKNYKEEEEVPAILKEFFDNLWYQIEAAFRNTTLFVNAQWACNFPEGGGGGLGGYLQCSKVHSFGIVHCYLKWLQNLWNFGFAQGNTQVYWCM